MPELPEVEVICRGLRPHLKGRMIKKVRYSGKNLRTPVPMQLMDERLCGATVTGVNRRAKYLLLTTDSQDILLIHLGMTGRLGLFKSSIPAALHDHLHWLLDNDLELRFNDTRRFGSIHLFTAADREEKLKNFFEATGPEPFSSTCNVSYLQKRAKDCRQAVKTFIMNGSIVAGVGNIYANESLFRAGIHPATPAGTLSHRQWQNLIEAIREILNWAIECGGSTISDFINASGERGYFQANFRVYGKKDFPCSRCKTLLQKEAINGRASFFCPRCQPRRE